MNDKAALRRYLRSLYPGPDERNRQSNAMCRHILRNPVYRAARVVGAYIPMAREADVTPVLVDALSAGKTLALPLCGEKPEMTLRKVCSLDELVPGAYGIPEPRRDAPVIDPGELDMLLVPLEGVDLRGMRLGKGGGYYDCLLKKTNAYAMGCALSWQWADEIPADAWDEPLWACADMKGIALFDNNSKEGT